MVISGGCAGPGGVLCLKVGVFFGLKEGMSSGQYSIEYGLLCHEEPVSFFPQLPSVLQLCFSHSPSGSHQGSPAMKVLQFWMQLQYQPSTMAHPT